MSRMVVVVVGLLDEKRMWNMEQLIEFDCSFKQQHQQLYLLTANHFQDISKGLLTFPKMFSANMKIFSEVKKKHLKVFFKSILYRLKIWKIFQSCFSKKEVPGGCALNTCRVLHWLDLSVNLLYEACPRIYVVSVIAPKPGWIWHFCSYGRNLQTIVDLATPL